MNEKEMSRYIELNDEAIKCGVNQLKRAMRLNGRRYTKDDMDDVAQELRIVMWKCLKNFKPWYRSTLETYIASSIRSNVFGKTSDQFKKPKDGAKNKCSEIYFSASLSEPIDSEDGYRELVDIIVDDRLPSEPRLDAVIFSEGLLSMLGPKMRGRILGWIDGMTFGEIAASEGISRQGAQDSIKRGIDKLREIVDNQGKGNI